MPSTIPPVTDLELIDELLLEWRATDRSRANARNTLARFADYCATHGTDLGGADAALCRRWLAERGEQVSAATCVKNWSQLKAFYTIAQDDIANPLDGRRSPMARIPMPRAPKFARTKAATADEVAALIRHCGDLRSGLGLRNATMISLMFRTGLRVGELPQLMMHDLNLDTQPPALHIGITKTDVPRIVPIHPETLTLLRRYLRRRGTDHGPLFVNIGGRKRSSRLTTNACQNIVNRAADAAEVDISAHCLRRGFVVEYLANGGDIATLMVIGGWSSEVMIYRYMGDLRDRTAHAVFADVAARQVAGNYGRRLRAVD